MLENFLYFLSVVLLIIGCKTNPPTSPENGTPQLGKVYITSNIVDAEIWLDDVSTGQLTPDTIETTVGTHTITLKKVNYVDASQLITIIKDSTLSLSISLTQEFGKVYVTSNAAGAQIFIDLINSGKVTPDTILTTQSLLYLHYSRSRGDQR